MVKGMDERLQRRFVKAALVVIIAVTVWFAGAI
jgi:hypothetical protein